MSENLVIFGGIFLFILLLVGVSQRTITHKWDKWDMRDVIENITLQEKDAWMGEYDADEVGEYLSKFGQVQSGGKSWLEANNYNSWKIGKQPTRANFLLWRFNRGEGGQDNGN